MDVLTFAKTHNLPLSAIQLKPEFNTKKNRVSKGEALPHFGWKDKGRFEPKSINKTPVDNSSPYAYLMAIKKQGIIVIDIDRLTDATVEQGLGDVQIEQFDTYTVRTGSGGIHLYYSIPDIKIKTKIDSKILLNHLIIPEYRNQFQIDVICDGIITEGSKYSFEDKTYQYSSCNKSINEIREIPEGLLDLIKTTDYVEEKIEIKCDFPILERVVRGINKSLDLYGNWITIGMAMKTQGLQVELWDDISKQSEKYKAGQCHIKWRTFKKDDTCKLKTLLYFLRKDSPHLYDELNTLIYGEEKWLGVVQDKWLGMPLIEKEKIEKQSRQKERITIEHDKDAGIMLYNQMKERLVYCKGEFFFKIDRLWRNGKDIQNLIRSEVMDADLFMVNKKDEETAYSSFVRNANNITTYIMDCAIKNVDDSFKKKAISSTIGYVLFNNGYFSMKEHRFYTDNPSHLYFLEKIPFDYIESDPDYEKDIEKRLFTDCFGTIGDYYLLTLSIALAGEAFKQFLVGIGFTNSGKSLLTGALSHSIGGYFSGWDASNLFYKQTSQDSAQSCRWMMLLDTKRIIMSNELKSTGSLDANQMKSLSNGGNDPITGRLHGGNETQFNLSLLPILFAQELPVIKPIDDAILKRLVTIPYKKSYVDEVTNDEYELKKDPNIENEIKTDRFRASFLGLMFKRYYQYCQDGKYVDPEEMKEAREEIIGDDTNIITSFLKDFEITENEQDYIRSSRITSWLNEERKAIHITKFASELKKYCVINKKKVENNYKKLGGKTVKCWFGVKEREE